MKFLALVILTVVQTFLFAQKIAFEKVISENIELEELEFNDRENYIRYYTLGDDYVLRFEDIKVQLYNYNFNRIWEIKFERIESGFGDFNDFDFVYDKEYIYLMQKSDKSNHWKTEIEIVFYKINFNGQIEKTIKFKEPLGVQDVKSIEINEDNIFILWTKTERSGINSPAHDGTSEYHTYITKLDKDLAKIGATIELPFLDKKGKHNSEWLYKTFLDEQFTFVKSYTIMGNGKYSNYYEDCDECQSFIEFLMIDTSLQIANFERVHAEKASSEQIKIFNSHINLKYDTTEFVFKYFGLNVFIGGEIAVDKKISFTVNFESFSRENSVMDFVLTSGYQVSQNLSTLIPIVIERFKKFGKFRITNVLNDPINNGLVMLVDYGYNSYIEYYCFFNENLKITSVLTTKTVGLGLGGKNNQPNSHNFRFGRKSETIQNSLGHKKNAFDLAIDKFPKKMCTIINFENHQILLVDDLKSKTSTVYKIAR